MNQETMTDMPQGNDKGTMTDKLQEQRDDYIKRVARAITKRNVPKDKKPRMSSASFAKNQRLESQSQRRAFMRSFQQYPIETGYYQKLAETRRIPYQTMVERTVHPNF